MKRILLLMMMCLLCIPTQSLANDKIVPSGIPVKNLEETVDGIIKNYIGEEIPGLALAIVKDGEIILLKGYGHSDIEKKTPIDPKKTVFEAASVSKLYTWSAIMQLVEKGELDLQADIMEYLPQNYLELKFDEKITLLNLMNHTAGFEARADNIVTIKPEEMIPLEKFLSKEHQPKQVFKPGTVVSYSNYGTSLAGYIIERVTDQPFADYMQKEVLDKLHMESSTFDPKYDHMPSIVNNKSYGYEKKKEHFNQIERVYVNDGPAGSLNTTAKDMAYFMLAHLDKNQKGDYQLFDKAETLRTMHEQSNNIHPNLPGNAHGFWERLSGGNRVLEHGGKLVGYTSQLSLVPEENFGISILMNVANEATGLRTDLIAALIGDDIQGKQVSKSENDALVRGTYRMASGIYSNFISFLPIISNGDFRITDNTKGGIDVHTPFGKKPIHYVETKPFFYERVNKDLTIMDKSGMDMSRIAFEVDKDQKIIKMSFGVITDLIPVKMMERVSFNLFLIAISVIVFLLYIVLFVINFIRRKLKARKGRVKTMTKGDRFTFLLASTGMLVVFNIIILFIRYFSNPFQSVQPLQVHIYINWLLPLMTIFCTYIFVRNFKQTKLLLKLSQLLLVVISIVFSVFLGTFHLLF